MKNSFKVLVGISVLVGCDFFLRDDVTGVYKNEMLNCEILVKDSIYVYKVNGKQINRNEYRISKSSDKIIFMNWIDGGGVEIYNDSINGRICVAPIDKYGITFSADEDYKNFEKVR